MRQCFHSQLKILWARPPLINFANLRNPSPPPSKISLVKQIEGFEFVPLVSQRIHKIAQLDITFLRPEAPGSIIQSGDIDNRIKTLFDALRMPTEAEVNQLKSFITNQIDKPFFCLLEDDNLITHVSVKAEQLLEEGISTNEVILLIQVHTKVTELILGNMGLGS